MNTAMKKATLVFLALVLPITVWGELPASLSAESVACIECHKQQNPGIYEQWGASKHFRANVGCYECHKAEKGDKDAIDHFNTTISVIVSSKDCERCHKEEVAQLLPSHHSKAARILGFRREAYPLASGQ